MSHYTKERNILTFHLDGVNGVYTLNIENGVFTGLKGTPIKTCQKKNQIRNIMNGNNTHHLERVLSYVFEYGYTAHYPNFVRAMTTAERLDNMHFEGAVWGIDEYDYIGQTFDEFVRYRRTLEEGQRFSVANFRDWLIAESSRRELGVLADMLTPNMYNQVKQYLANPTKEEWAVAAYYLSRGKVWEYDGGAYRVCEYLRLCREMEKKPDKQNNFMREYVETKKTYELNKKQYEDNRLRQNYALHSKAFEFTFGEYSVVVPTCAKDIVDEGQNMHHCVGGYVGRVVNGETYIVFIRKTETPDKCYLTCQVHTNGEIGQYYLAYDNRISKQDDIEFYNAFARHLRENWNNN